MTLIEAHWDGRSTSPPDPDHMFNTPRLSAEEKQHAHNIGYLIEQLCAKTQAVEHLDVTVQASAVDGVRFLSLTVTTTPVVELPPISDDASWDPAVKRSLYAFNGIGRPNLKVWLEVDGIWSQDGQPLFYFAEDTYGDGEPTTKGARYETAGWTLYDGLVIEGAPA